MKYCLYSSYCVGKPFETTDIEIFRCSQQNNKKYGISGYLLRTQSFYFHYIEGEASALERLVRNLKSDTRHFGLYAHSYGEAHGAKISGWSMGYCQLVDINSSVDPIQQSCSTVEILNYVLAEAERQTAQLESCGAAKSFSLKQKNNAESEGIRSLAERYDHRNRDHPIRRFS